MSPLTLYICWSGGVFAVAVALFLFAVLWFTRKRTPDPYEQPHRDMVPATAADDAALCASYEPQFANSPTWQQVAAETAIPPRREEDL
jgi:hypothetical protein